MYLIGIPLNLRNILQDLDKYVHHSVSFKYTKNLNIFFQASDGQIYHGCSGSIKFFSVDANISDPPVKSIFQTSLDDEGRKLIPNILWVNIFLVLKLYIKENWTYLKQYFHQNKPEIVLINK
jgi:hypothetical protein